MCVAALALAQHARFPVVLWSNRDEFFDRPAQPLTWWRPDGSPVDILSGRDLSAGGTWLGLRGDGHLALLTNVREPGRVVAGAVSRGTLVTDWLKAPRFDPEGLRALGLPPRNGFNLLVLDLRDGRARWMANHPPQQQAIAAGVHGLSNAAWDTPWPKVSGLRNGLAASLRSTTATAADVLADAFDALADQKIAPDAALPATGVNLALERQLSPVFIRADAAPAEGRARYGTRCSTVVIVEQTAGGARQVHVVERRFDEAAQPLGQTLQRFDLSA